MNWIIIKKDRGNILSIVVNLFFSFVFYNGSQKEHERVRAIVTWKEVVGPYSMEKKTL